MTPTIDWIRARAEAWDEGFEAVAWCLDNGEPSAAVALAYVHQNNRYRLAPDVVGEDNNPRRQGDA